MLNAKQDTNTNISNTTPVGTYPITGVPDFESVYDPLNVTF